MKKILLSLGAALFLAAGAQAQTGYGLKAGVNLGKYSNMPRTSNNTSFYITGFADLPVAPSFSIQPGVSLQGKGSKYIIDKYESGGTIFEEADASINVMSIEIPVNAVYYIPTGESGKVFLGAGPYIGFNISGKGKIKAEKTENSGNSTIVKNVDIEETLKLSGDNRSLNVIDAGLNFMVGYKFNNGFLLNAGYNLGLTNNIHKSDKTHANRVWQFGVGFQF